MKKYKYVYVRGRVDSEENAWAMYNNTTEDAAVKKFTRSLRRDYDVDKSTDVYMEVVVASDHEFTATDGCEF